MIGFIIPFRPKAASKNWELDLLLLKRTVLTILKGCDDSNSCHVYVVHTELPEINVKHPSLSFLQFPFLEMDVTTLDDFDSLLERHYDIVYFKRHLDKSRKIMWGCKIAKEAGCNYLMNVDSDDLISDKLIPYIKEQDQQKDGWYIPGGYVHEFPKRYLRKVHSTMHFLNGSTHIVRSGLIAIPDMETKEWTDINFFTDHGYIKERVRIELQGQLHPVPFKAVVYTRTGVSNISEPHLRKLPFFKRVVKQVLLYQYLTKALEKEFNLGLFREELIALMKKRNSRQGEEA